MRVLVTWGSKRGGTEGVARAIGDALTARGLEVVTASAERVQSLDIFDAVIVGGALYGNRWPAGVRRFVRRNVPQLRKVPVWFFSSGPLDDSADRVDIPPSLQVAVLAERVGCLGHVTFGGRLAPDAEGFPASTIAKTSAGDFRNFERIRAWAGELADRLPSAKPGVAVDHPARSLGRLFLYPSFGWAGCALQMLLLLSVASLGVALTVHAILLPIVFGALAYHYFRGRGAREPLAVATTWLLTVGVLDLVVFAGLLQRSSEMLRSVAGTWLPLALLFVVTWSTGAMMSTLPWPKSPQSTARSAA